MLDDWINNCLEPDKEFEKVQNFMRNRLFRVEPEPPFQNSGLKWKAPPLNNHSRKNRQGHHKRTTFLRSPLRTRIFSTYRQINLYKLAIRWSNDESELHRNACGAGSGTSRILLTCLCIAKWTRLTTSQTRSIRSAGALSTIFILMSARWTEKLFRCTGRSSTTRFFTAT